MAKKTFSDHIREFIEKRRIAQYKQCDDPGELLLLSESARSLVGPCLAIEIAECAYLHGGAVIGVRLQCAYNIMIWHRDLSQDMFVNQKKKEEHARLVGKFFTELCELLKDTRVSGVEKDRYAYLLTRYAIERGVDPKSVLFMLGSYA